MKEDLLEDFSSLKIIKCEKLVREIKEGKYHNGKSSIIQLKAINQKE
jgi:hypothetical protein